MKPVIISLLSFSVFLGCKPATEKAEVKVEIPAEVPVESPTSSEAADSLSSLTNPDVKVQDDFEPPKLPSKDEPKPVAGAPKSCNPNFTKLASPVRNPQFYYVTGFTPLEFKCWNELEAHAVDVCGGVPCTILYLDKAQVKLSSTPPLYIHRSTLETSGIARFDYNGKFWEIKGSRAWKREGKGYDYYNTDNHLGG
jgi:hypothetical protein